MDARGLDGAGRRKAARRIQETRDLKPAVLELCQLLRLHVAHFRPARMKDGTWRTPVEADGDGFLDLVIVGYDVLWRELKTFGRKPTAAQLEWMARLEQAGQDAGVWTGEDLLSGRIERELKAIARPANRQ